MLRVFRFLLALLTTTNVVDVPMTPASWGDLGGHVFVSWSIRRVLIGPSVLRLFVRDSINARLKSHVCQDYWQILFGGLALKNRNETKNSLHMTAYSGKLPAPPYPFRDKYIPVEVAHMPPLFSVMGLKQG